MSKSTHQFEVKGVDNSGGAFSSIKARAAATAAQIRSMVGGAIAAAGAYMSFRAIKGGIDELGHLSDIAQKTSTDVGELTQTVAALNVLGIQNMGVDQLGKAFDYMAKTTGRTGMAGFYQTIGELGKIPDVATRGQEAMRIFGRSGMEFMPLINAANNGTAALQGVIAAMPGIPQAAADAGDDIADGTDIIVREFHSLWLQGIAAVCKEFTDGMPSSARQGAAITSAYMEYWIKNIVTIVQSAWARIKGFGSAVGETIGSAVGAFAQNAKWHDWVALLTPGGAIAKIVAGKITGQDNAFTQAIESGADGWKRGMEEMEMDFEEFEKVIEARSEKLGERLGVAFNLERNYKRAAKSTADRVKLDNLNGQGGIGSFSPMRISNDLIMGGSNAATRLQILGPTLQSEQQKTNALLEQVVENTKQTANNTEDKTGDELYALDT